tara:strand:+ start:1180 stop:1467 length:288 start_codon:yes stop_codon:yes gene_type:complete
MNEPYPPLPLPPLPRVSELVKNGSHEEKEAKQERKTLIYRKLNGETKMYDIESPSTDNLFGNKRENLDEAGFKAKVRNRGNDWRSFRYDGVIALA